MAERILDGGFPDQTLTVQEAQYVLYRAGVDISRDYIKEGLKQGLFPFGFAVKLKEYKYVVFRKALADYIMTMTGQKAIFYGDEVEA
jgi:hypothetical protein